VVRVRGWILFVGILLTAGLGLAFWRLLPRAPALAAPAPFEAPLPEYEALAFDCLAFGLGDGSEPPPDDRLPGLTAFLARFLQTYMTGDYRSFLQLHRLDVDEVGRRRVADVERIDLILVNELHVAEGDLPRGDWIDHLGEFWRRVYVLPPIDAVHAEHTRIAYARARGADLATRLGPFGELPNPDGKFVNHLPSVPHRRAYGDCLDPAGELECCELELHPLLQSTDGFVEVVLQMKLYFDPGDQQWVLHAARTSYPEGWEPGARPGTLYL